MNWRLSFWLSISVFILTLIVAAVILLSRDWFSLSLRSVTVSGDAATYVVELDANAEWILLTTPSDWCHVDPFMSYYAGVTEITITLDANPFPIAREARLIFYSGNAVREFLVRQQPGVHRIPATPQHSFASEPIPAPAVRPAPAPRPQTAPPSRPTPPPAARPASQPMRPTHQAVRSAPQTATHARPAPPPTVYSAPTPQPAHQPTPPPQQAARPAPPVATAQPAPTQPPVRAAVQEGTMRRSDLRTEEVPMGPCMWAEVFDLRSTANFICGDGQPVVFSLSGSQPDVSYQLFRNGRPVTGYVPGRSRGEELTFPGNFLESGVYTARSVPASGRCATDMRGRIGLTVVDPFHPGRIESSNIIIDRGVTPPPIKSLTPAWGGDGNIRYQWAVNGRFIPGANEETYHPPALSYSATYTRMAHDGTCQIPWVSAQGEAVVRLR